MESSQKTGEQSGRRKQSSGTLPIGPIGERTISALLKERAIFHRFVASRIGDDATAEDLFQESLLRALEQGSKLRRGESAVAWFYRVLRHAIFDHFRRKGAESRRAKKLLADMQAREEDVAAQPADWDAAVGACFRGLIPALKPRYAEVIRRVDLRGESKLVVGRDLKLTRATMDVLLHRARSALRRQLEILCRACSREKCIECFCARERV